MNSRERFCINKKGNVMRKISYTNVKEKYLLTFCSSECITTIEIVVKQ